MDTEMQTERDLAVDWLEHKAASCEEEARCYEDEADIENQFSMAAAYRHAADCIRRGVHMDEAPEDDPALSEALDAQIDSAFGKRP